ncbi:Nif3-like dinuclear metal center hexameric protein, partial [Georgenia sp. 10Sc9-8]|nr:Nif3-like dinuclear metal center hexameric protein [Georgenia halotolerans]
PKGRLVHELVRGGCALYTAHTNADAAEDGVAQALAELLGLQDLRPLAPAAGQSLDTLVTFVPTTHTHDLLDALAAAGAGSLGDYERCAYTSGGTGTFRPLPGAHPTIGAVGRAEEVAEDRIEMVLPRGRRSAVVRALRAAHPYEEPAFTLLEHATTDASTGIGRVGELPEPLTLQALGAQVADVLPATPAGIRVGGDLAAQVRTVAVSGGAGDSLLGAARAAGAEVFLTADLRHHPASEHLAAGPPYLIDATHWASEWPWLPRAAGLLEQDAEAAGAPLSTRVSSRSTDPWALQLAPTTNDDEGAPL